MARCVAVWLWLHSLDSQLLAVTEGEAVISECAQHDGGVHHVLLEAQEPHVQALKPHQHSVLCKRSNYNRITQTDLDYLIIIQ